MFVAKSDAENFHEQATKNFKESMGSMIKTPMTRDEALKILNIEHEEDEEPEAKAIMERFETIFEKNLPEKGGSFYIQSKVYFAKEFLMQDYPVQLNMS